MRISPYISAGVNLSKYWFLLNLTPQDKNGFTTFDESLYGSWDIVQGIARLSTSATNNNYISVGADFTSNLILNWDKERRANFWVDILTLTNQQILLISGNDLGDQYVGFKIINNALWGVSKKAGEAEAAILLQTVEVATYSFSFIFKPNAIVQFYVNNVYKGNLTSSIPTGLTDAQYPVRVRVRNTAAELKRVYFHLLEFLQRK